MSYWFVFKKTLESKVLYINQIIFENVAIIFQGLFSVFIGIYMNSVNPVFSSFNELATYYFFSAIINSFQRGNVVNDIEKEVINGNINVHFAKPYDFIIYKNIKHFSEKIYRVVFIALSFTAILYLISPYSISLVSFLRALIIIPFAVAFIMINTSIFCYISLFFEKSGRLSQIYLMLGYFIGGGLVSVKYFPKIIQFIPQFFFFGAPLEFILTGSFPNLALFIFYFLFFVGVNFLARKIIYRRIETNG